ncbi:tyrosine-type recombinase/integrase [Pseudomonas sp. A1230]|uniref:tyrosine-type recombinase/integrase n=1 Tax=Pseudomonas sp. A1230 TaxID=3235106 RepID=UPI00378349AC
MLLLWPSKKAFSSVQDTVRAAGLDALITEKEKRSVSNYPIPLIFDEVRGEVVREMHEFLYEKSFFSEYYKSDKTVKTYAECILSWLKYTALSKVDWPYADARDIALYRNSMKSKDDGRTPLSAATINLRLAVVYEFYKFYWAKKIREGSADQSVYAYKLNQIRVRKVRVKSTKKRPRALTQDSSLRLMQHLRGVHRVIFAWTLTTGLRVGSVLSIKSSQIELLNLRSSDGFIEVLAKGGKIQKAYVARALLTETNMYADVVRTLNQMKSSPWLVDETLFFINEKGAPVTRSCYYAAYKRACKQLSINSHPHQARTTFATFMERQLFKAAQNLGVDHVKIVQGLLGHSSSDTTQSYLERISGSHVEVLGILEKYAAVLGGANEE